jgi:hypothetical protein
MTSWLVNGRALEIKDDQHEINDASSLDLLSRGCPRVISRVANREEKPGGGGGV